MALTKDEIDQIIRDVKDNQARLEACPKHRFTNVGCRDEGYSRPYRSRQCEHCGGKMEDSDIMHYARGYKAAGGNPADVCVFFDGTTL